MENFVYASELPYPKIETTNDLRLAKMLLPSYAGIGSETTAVMTYCYQVYISPKYAKIQDALEHIAVVEMKHHEILGKLIYALGGYPIIGARQYWNGAMANYTLNPKKFLKENIEAEKAAIRNYEQTILNTDNENVKTILSRIILDEELHIKIFETLLNEMEE